jgi:hypothetical protein
MSITYDPEKWSNPSRARDFEPSKKKTKSLVLVPARELRHFKITSGSNSALFSQIVSQDENKPVIISKPKEEGLRSSKYISSKELE